MSLFFNRSVSIPRSGSIASQESYRELLCPSHVLFNPAKPLTRSKLFSLKTPMTYIQDSVEVKVENTDGMATREESGRSSRPIRNRRYTRRSLVAGQQPPKRLFTPEIKRYLKDWLVRRRENPYPNREEKKYLSNETGLTYTQICNWFANWRRKLKNVNNDRNQQNWGHLIRTYNDSAQGNVEQFSISSDDSIWSEPRPSSPSQDTLDNEYVDSPEPDTDRQEESDGSSYSKETYENNNSYVEPQLESTNEESKNVTSPLLLSKWLESAARFQPSEINYSWWADERRRKPEQRIKLTINTSRHDRDEVEAAVALTALATATNRVTT